MHILIADDHPLYRLALRQAVAESAPGATIGEAEDLAGVQAALDAAPETDLVLLDLHMPGAHGLGGLAALRGAHPAVAVVIVSAHEDPATVRRALDFGAAGYIPKRAGLEQLRSGLRAVLDCEVWLPLDLREAVERTPAAPQDGDLAARLTSLTLQQFRVLSLVAEGRLNKQIADALGIQERTVKAHMTVVFEKLGVRNRTQAGILMRSLDVRDAADEASNE
ncbi:response regulator transcription factor [Coralloluteibacterium stylophorae]|uniref:Response regulator transcription factor n=1 Tax=Coralloluteibacterium stylophorae TaxID=1776034 RepID=A0A8J8B0Z2_9GAMM|nr:response regulator transcription factor [Coralloluteibacterium stylophorae]MBS7457575.1 response regulator transcription factor [Coralloluteibacterium stylophorae]